VAYPWVAAIFRLTPKFWGLKKPELIRRLLGLNDLRFGTGYKSVTPVVVEVDTAADGAAPPLPPQPVSNDTDAKIMTHADLEIIGQIHPPSGPSS